MIDKGHTTLPVINCARCGQTHKEILFNTFDIPLEDSDGLVWQWWGMCPVSRDPIIMRKEVLEDNEGQND